MPDIDKLGPVLSEIEQSFRVFASYVALALELAAILIVAGGATEAVILTARRLIGIDTDASSRRLIWIHFASWILLSLEFALGADVVGTAISPTWNAIAQLAAIAAIRTGLNYFLGRDIENAASLDFMKTATQRSP